MEKQILAVANYEKQKYFIEPKFETLPEEIQKELKVICVLTAQKLCCTFLIGFKKEGNIYFEIIKPEQCIDFDDIGAELEIKKIQSENKELLKKLKVWYTIFFTEQGKKLRQQLLQKKEI
ncbi:DUF6145 family protein [Clostridium sp. MD294]|uniref:DUF6145 family protein n=1 Tax=Clostridium sp. MD294 TaxID=97138 RepID=UPI0002CAB999|nr:DUF6145 family protein [Clostridium sp. MD294]NDO46465.1 hypothetical protein [Clostridium sp. MD294]USF29105.1 hypothetical protein C820_000488 [Clostridium sp. MD294]